MGIGFCHVLGRSEAGEGILGRLAETREARIVQDMRRGLSRPVLFASRVTFSLRTRRRMGRLRVCLGVVWSRRSGTRPAESASPNYGEPCSERFTSRPISA